MAGILDSGVKLVRNVGRYYFGASSLDELPGLLRMRRQMAGTTQADSRVVFFLDEYFRAGDALLSRLGIEVGDIVEYVETADEPTTDRVDAIVARLHGQGCSEPAAIVGLGGGITMDIAKATANLLTNGGRAQDYQGWDLVKVPGIFKVGIPTLSGTGAEATRTCVLTNPANGLKLGMNSDHTVFDHVIMDPELTKTVPRNQYFYTGMDAYIHCVEALSGTYRNAVGDAYSRETINLCRQVFGEGDMMSPQNRERMMVASYLGGCAIATSYVGVVHPLSAALSVVLKVHHCVANCIVMRAMAEYYPEAYAEFWQMVERQGVTIPEGICRDLDSAGFDALHKAATVHEKPLTNALGADFRALLTREKTEALFRLM